MLVDSGIGYLEVTGTSFQTWNETTFLGKTVQTGTIVEVIGGHRLVFDACVPAGACANAPRMIELVRP